MKLVKLANCDMPSYQIDNISFQQSTLNRCSTTDNKLCMNEGPSLVQPATKRRSGIQPRQLYRLGRTKKKFLAEVFAKILTLDQENFETETKLYFLAD